jgi:hypothetical protein
VKRTGSTRALALLCLFLALAVAPAGAPALTAYAGWGWMHFGVEESFAGSNVDYEETAFTFGLRFEHPLSGDAGPAYWLRAGGLYGHVELEDSHGDRLADSGHGLGWEVGAGVGLDFHRARLTPGLRFRVLSRDVAVEDITTDVDLWYLAAEIGVRFAL